ncbi:MAG: hypothetical protein GWP63_15370 [Haliea sp.]|nr:hypothetical protein [Haliea sp.]
MTAYELNDLMMSWYAMMGQDANMYLALVSGYLIVAYSIGAKLSSVQAMIINVFFAVWTGSHVMAIFSEMGAVLDIQQMLIDMEAYSFQSPNQSLAIASLFAAIQIGGIIAALYFMWTIRHPKSE